MDEIVVTTDDGSYYCSVDWLTSTRKRGNTGVFLCMLLSVNAGIFFQVLLPEGAVEKNK